MNFETWFEEQNKAHKSLYGGFGILETHKEKLKEGWDACKEEVLKILNDEYNHETYDTDGGCADAISPSVISEINKL